MASAKSNDLNNLNNLKWWHISWCAKVICRCDFDWKQCKLRQNNFNNQENAMRDWPFNFLGGGEEGYMLFSM